MYWSSPSSLAKELLRLPWFPSGFGSMGTLGSKGVLTEFDLPRPSLLRIDSIERLEGIAMESGVIVISISTIFEGSPKSVTSHSLSISDFILSMSDVIVAKRSRSSTHTVMIAKCSLTRQIYTQGSQRKRV